jgi:hypothetical protein
MGDGCDKTAGLPPANGATANSIAGAGLAIRGARRDSRFQQAALPAAGVIPAAARCQ